MSRILQVFWILLIPGWVLAHDAQARARKVVTVDLEQAMVLYQQGAVFIDIRPGREWSWGHVYGAVHLDLYDEFGNLEEKRWPRNIPLVIYDDSALSQNSQEAARLAVAWGYRQVFCFQGGYFAWQLADLPQGKGLVGELSVLSAQNR